MKTNVLENKCWLTELEWLGWILLIDSINFVLELGLDSFENVNQNGSNRFENLDQDNTSRQKQLTSW